MNVRDESRWPSMWGAGQDAVRLPTLDATAQPDEEEWRHAAACRRRDDDLFFPVGSSPKALAQTARAKEVCDRCPVTTECLAFALDSDEDFGVWGGLDEYERRTLRRRRARGTS